MHDTDEGGNSTNVYSMGKEQRLVDAGGQVGVGTRKALEDQRHGGEIVWIGTRNATYGVRLTIW